MAGEWLRSERHADATAEAIELLTLIDGLTVDIGSSEVFERIAGYGIEQAADVIVAIGTFLYGALAVRAMTCGDKPIDAIRSLSLAAQS